MLPVSTGVTVFDAIVLVAEPIVPFATRVMVILSPIFAYMLFFVLLLSIVNVSSPSGFACTVTVLFIESGTLPAASGDRICNVSVLQLMMRIQQMQILQEIPERV